MKYRTIWIAGIAVALPAGAALAAGGGTQSQAEQGMTEQEATSAMEQLDTDGDGQLAREEVQGTELEQHFATLDENGDGVIDVEEFRAGSGVGGPLSDQPAQDQATPPADQSEEGWGMGTESEQQGGAAY